MEDTDVQVFLARVSIYLTVLQHNNKNDEGREQLRICWIWGMWNAWP